LFTELRTELVAAAKLAARSGLVQEQAGNFSLRVPGEDLILVTPTGIHRAALVPEDIVVVDLYGNVVDGFRKPTSETTMHTALLRSRPDFGGAAHTHSPYATAFACLNMPIPNIVAEQAAHFGGTIKVAPYATPYTQRLADSVTKALGDDGVAVMMEYHGVMVGGKTVADAVMKAIYVEDVAKIYHYALQIGTPKAMPSQEVKYLFDRARGVVS
jgi:L-ribulose-5-phosphate 4-epimerase